MTEESEPGFSNKTQDDTNKDDRSLFDCIICQNTAKNIVVSKCGHLFCWPCLYQWLETRPNNKRCPLCKMAIGKDKVIPLYGCGSTKEEDPRNSLPPRPSGQRIEPETNRGFPFGNRENRFHMFFRIGAYSFSSVSSSFNFGEPRRNTTPRGTSQYEEGLFIKVFVWVVIIIIFWLLLT